MDKTRKTATVTAALLLGGTAARRRRNRPEPFVARGMCFKVASFADVDNGRDYECVVL
jgi:hypothetical protein